MRERVTPPNTVRPIGNLAELLEEFEAPEKVRLTLASRVGGVTNSKLIGVEDIREIIIDHMDDYGRPRWNNVLHIVGEVAKRAYQGKKIFIRFR